MVVVLICCVVLEVEGVEVWREMVLAQKLYDRCEIMRLEPPWAATFSAGFLKYEMTRLQIMS